MPKPDWLADISHLVHEILTDKESVAFFIEIEPLDICIIVNFPNIKMLCLISFFFLIRNSLDARQFKEYVHLEFSALYLLGE